jgi:hypothetical protein
MAEDSLTAWDRLGHEQRGQPDPTCLQPWFDCEDHKYHVLTINDLIDLFVASLQRIEMLETQTKELLQEVNQCGIIGAARLRVDSHLLASESWQLTKPHSHPPRRSSTSARTR